MTQKQMKNIIKTLIWMIACVLFTIFAMTFDKKPIAPDGSPVGFGSINDFFFSIFGAHKVADVISDIFSVLSIAVALFFTILGLIQLIKRKNIFKVDMTVICMGIVYAITIALYILFILCPVNMAPYLEDGEATASFPSSHTMTIVAIFLTAAAWVGRKVKNARSAEIITYVLYGSSAVLVIFRLFSGAHWFTDIVGGVIYAFMLSSLYSTLLSLFCVKKKNPKTGRSVK